MDQENTEKTEPCIEMTERHDARDFWTLNGSRTFGIFPGGILDKAPNDTPIYLQRGNRATGATHIQHTHGAWLKKLAMSVPEVVWRKCQQPGQIFNTEEANKLKVLIYLAPSALLVARYVNADKPFFTVVTVYFHEGALDGIRLGRFPGRKQPEERPIFALEEAKKIEVIYKKRRSILKGET